MLDWIFEGIVKWVAGVASELLDTVSGLFLDALGTDMTAMEEYFPFVTKAFTVMQYCSWAILFLITVWQAIRPRSALLPPLMVRKLPSRCPKLRLLTLCSIPASLLARLTS